MMFGDFIWGVVAAGMFIALLCLFAVGIILIAVGASNENYWVLAGGLVCLAYFGGALNMMDNL